MIENLTRYLNQLRYLVPPDYIKYTSENRQ
jgi:hypothetical protein